jgi:hypothetical protein
MTEMSVNNKTEINAEKIKLGLEFVFCHDTVDQIQYVMVPNKSFDIVESFGYVHMTARNKHCVQETKKFNSENACNQGAAVFYFRIFCLKT